MPPASPYFAVCSAITAQAIAQTKPLSSLAIAVVIFPCIFPLRSKTR